MVWYLECTPVITSHLKNGSAFAFLHLLNTILGLWIFNACSKYFVTECEWFGFCRWTSPCVGMFAPWIYFLCPSARGILNMRDWIAPSSGRLSVCNAAFAMFFLFFFFNVHDYIKEWLVLSSFWLDFRGVEYVSVVLFCLFWVDVMLWCCVLREIKKKVDHKKKKCYLFLLILSWIFNWSKVWNNWFF